jgi:hypothetical protein
VLRRKIKGMLCCSIDLGSRSSGSSSSSSSSRRKRRRRRRGNRSRSRIRSKRSSSTVATEAVVSERKAGSNVCDSSSSSCGSSFSDCRDVIIKQRWGLTLYISILLSCEVRNRSYSILE